MGLFDIFNRKKKEKEIRLQREAERLKKEEALKVYKAIDQAKKLNSSVDYIAIAAKFSSFVFKHEYHSLLECLDKITLPQGKLIIEGIKPEISRDKSILMIALQDGKSDENIFDYLQVEQSCMGAWQSYLLNSLWHVLPLFGHAIYDSRDYLFTKEDIQGINALNEADKTNIVRIISNIDITPEVFENNGKYYISCCYWNNFYGFVREYSEINIENNKVTDIVQFDEKTEYYYDCGMRF